MSHELLTCTTIRHQVERESALIICGCPPPDTGLRRYESWVGGQRLAAQPGPATVSQLLHGVPGGCPHVGPPDQEGAERTAQNGGQLSQVGLGSGVPALASLTAVYNSCSFVTSPVFTLILFRWRRACVHLCGMGNTKVLKDTQGVLLLLWHSRCSGVCLRALCKEGSKAPDCVNAFWVQVRVETRPQLTCFSCSPSGFFDLSQGQFALRHHVPEASELRSQGAGEEERGERPPEQRWALLFLCHYLTVRATEVGWPCPPN